MEEKAPDTKKEDVNLYARICSMLGEAIILERYYQQQIEKYKGEAEEVWKRIQAANEQPK